MSKDPSYLNGSAPSTPQGQAVTQLLHAAAGGEKVAVDRLFTMVYDELRRMARTVRYGRAGETLNTTVLVHEAYLKLIPFGNVDWQDRVHFFRVAARAMRQVLVNAAHRRMAQKRGGGQWAVTLDEAFVSAPVPSEELIALDEALQLLETLDERQARIVEYRFFAGMTVEETAQALGVSAPTVKRDWRAARAWLARELQPNQNAKPSAGP